MSRLAMLSLLQRSTDTRAVRTPPLAFCHAQTCNTAPMPLSSAPGRYANASYGVIGSTDQLTRVIHNSLSDPVQPVKKSSPRRVQQQPSSASPCDYCRKCRIDELTIQLFSWPYPFDFVGMQLRARSLVVAIKISREINGQF